MDFSGAWFVAPRGLIGALLAAGLVASCSFQDPPQPSDPELRGELGISADVRIHRIDLSSRRDQTLVLPLRTEILPGELVQFVVLDHRVHLVRFDEQRLGASAREFLRETGQDSPPPLLEQGARLVLSFEGAPLGLYPFIIDGDGTQISGEIRVADSRR